MAMAAWLGNSRYCSGVFWTPEAHIYVRGLSPHMNYTSLTNNSNNDTLLPTGPWLDPSTTTCLVESSVPSLSCESSLARCLLSSTPQSVLPGTPSCFCTRDDWRPCRLARQGDNRRNTVVQDGWFPFLSQSYFDTELLSHRSRWTTIIISYC